ncbi:MAG TPA: PAS domain-containing protein [Myxococcota bacterium]|nr:PAS domain-containing protein [Myxococcota bacterium]HQK49890.1 PAS domain-containing protein [Myxococcota bacterium]
MSLTVPGSVLESMRIGVLVTDLQGRPLYRNRIAIDLLGEEEVPLPEWSIHHGLCHPDTREPIDASFFSVPAFPGNLTGAERVFLVPGEADRPDRYVSILAHPWTVDSAGAPGVVLLLQDVTDRHLATRELLRDRAFLESIVENVPAMIFVKEASELRFERFNRAGEELLGLPRETLIGRNDYDFFPKEQADFFTRLDREALRSETPVDIPEEPIQTARGQRWLHTRKVPIRDATGVPVYLLGISVDITEQKTAVEAIQRAREELEVRVAERTADLARANEELRREVAERQRAEQALRTSEAMLRQAQKMEAIGRLAGGVAHDFNNMLTVILSYAQMIQEAPVAGTESSQEVGEIIAAAQRSAALTRQLLAFSRMQVLEPVPMDLAQAIDRMEGMLRRLIGEDIVLRTHHAPDRMRVMADPGQIEQVILNLAVNARDAMPEGGEISISTANEYLDHPLDTSGGTLAPGPYVTVTVSDTGVGMDAATLEHLFEPFFTTKPTGKGTGLGLSTCYGIIRQSGGDIVVQSAPGQGSTFRIYLPGIPADTAAKPQDRKAGPEPWVPTPGSSSVTVLLVEDEELVRAATDRILRAAGCATLLAKGPGEAMDLCESHPGAIDLLLTDLVMPEMNGRELAERISARRPGIRVLYVSGYTDNIVAHHGVLHQDVSLLSKPFTPESLVQRVWEVLGLGPAGPSGEGMRREREPGSAQ